MFLSLPGAGGCGGVTSQVCPKCCTNISNTHFTVIGIFYNNIMHTLSPSDLPPLSHNYDDKRDGRRGNKRRNRGRGRRKRQQHLQLQDLRTKLVKDYHFLPLSVRGGTAAAPPGPPPGRRSMSCMMTYILHNNYNYTRAVYYYYDRFLPLSVWGTRQHFLLPRPKTQVCPKSCTNISNTHFTVIGIFSNNTIMHTLSPSALPPLSHMMTRGEGGEGRRDGTGAVGGGLQRQQDLRIQLTDLRTKLVKDDSAHYNVIHCRHAESCDITESIFLHHYY